MEWHKGDDHLKKNVLAKFGWLKWIIKVNWSMNVFWNMATKNPWESLVSLKSKFSPRDKILHMKKKRARSTITRSERSLRFLTYDIQDFLPAPFKVIGWLGVYPTELLYWLLLPWFATMIAMVFIPISRVECVLLTTCVEVDFTLDW
jgi:hypothetical protein